MVDISGAFLICETRNIIIVQDFCGEYDFKYLQDFCGKYDFKYLFYSQI